MRNKPLFLQLLIFVLPIYIIGFGVQYYFVGPFIERFRLDEVQRHLSKKANLISLSINSLSKETNLQEFVRKSGKNSNIRITIMDTNGVVFADSEKDPSLMENHRNQFKRKEIEQSIKNGLGVSQRYSTTINEDMLYVAILRDYNDSPFIIRTSESMKSLYVSIDRARNRIILISVIIMVIVIPAVIFVSSLITRPLFLIGKAAKKISAGDMQDPIPKLNNNWFSGTEEIHSIIIALNDMTTEIKSRIDAITLEKNEQKNILNFIRTIQRTMSEGLFTIDFKEKITSINQAGANYLSLDRKNSIGKNYNKTIKDKSFKKIIKTIIRKKRSITKEIKIGKEKKYYFNVNGKILKDQNNKAVGCLLVMTDITKLKQLEAVRRVFVANVSHELKTPITSIAGYIETALDDIPTDTKNDFLRRSLNQTTRLNSIIDDLLRLSRIEALEDENTFSLLKQNLLAVIDGSIEDVNASLKKFNKKIIIECPRTLSAKIDAQLLREAINNLLENAIKYSFDDSIIYIKVKRKGGSINIDIINQGEPIPKESLDRIFQRFYRVDKSRSKMTGGTGLGLAIVKHIALVHNATIRVLKSNETNTVFRFSLLENK